MQAGEPSDLASAGRGLSAVKGWLLRLHLAACDGCTRFNTQMQVLREAMRRYRS